MKPLKQGSHPQNLLTALLRGRNITAAYAVPHWHCFHLPDARFQLKKRGYPVKTDILPNVHDGNHAAYYFRKKDIPAARRLAKKLGDIS